MTPTLAQRLAAEGLGTAFLLATVVGSGIMGESLAAGNAAVALLANCLATGAILAVLITVLGPISGAHLNPLVSGVMTVRGELSLPVCAGYAVAQLSGAVLGVWTAHAMFGLPIIEISDKLRSGVPQWIAEAVATFGLLIAILGTIRSRPAAMPFTVGLYIVAAYWFTASTSFANPAVTVARALTDTFAGIAPSGVAGFVAAQAAGCALAVAAGRLLFSPPRSQLSPSRSGRMAELS